MTAEMPHYTLGQLISDLESSERAYEENLGTARRVEAKDGHDLASTWWRIQAAVLLFQPDPARLPGIDRIEALCDEWGTGLKAENVRRLRGKVCRKLGVGVTEANAMTIDAVATSLGLPAAGAKAEDGAFSSLPPAVKDLPVYNVEEQPWWTPLPEVRDVSSEELVSLADQIGIVLVTATDTEVEAVLRRMDPYPRRRAILKSSVGQETYYLGRFGSSRTAVTKCRVGSLDPGAATLATQHAHRVWRPKAIVMVGIAFGKDPTKQKIADVLVSSQVISYETQRIGEGQVVPRGPSTPASTTLLNRFENVPHWTFLRPDCTRCERHVGPLLSGEKLVDDPVFKKELFDRYPQAIGGEMEGAGFAAAAVRHDLPWILVKAICDWADGEKHKRHQPLAAAAAVSLVHHVLSQIDALNGLDKLKQTDEDFAKQLPERVDVSKQGDAHRETKKRRDLATIKSLFSVFPRPLVDKVLEEALSDRIHTDYIDCVIEAETIFRSTLFHLYDINLCQLLEDFFNHWEMVWDVGQTTHHDHLKRGIATLSVSETDPPEQWDEHERYLEHVMQARRAMAGLTRHLKENFPDFDLVGSDKQACLKYWEMADSSHPRPGRLRAGWRNTEAFVGRAHVFQEISTFLVKEKNGYFVIKGEPGVGKSALLAEYVRQTDCFNHFNSFTTSTTKTKQFIENISSQLVASCGMPVPTHPTRKEEYQDYLASAIDMALNHFGSGKKIVIAIDALDEVDDRPGRENVLCLPDELPTGVFFVVTKRSGFPAKLVTRVPTQHFDLRDYPDQNRADAMEYITVALGNRPEFKSWMKRQHQRIDDSIKRLADRSMDNFMYLSYVIPEIERGTYDDLALHGLPTGLDGYYDDHWDRMGLNTSHVPQNKLKIVYILAEIARPVAVDLISFLSDETPIAVQEVLNEWGQFLHSDMIDGKKHHAIYHWSFREFLHGKDIVQAVGLTLEGIHDLISSKLIGLEFWK